LDNYSRNYAVNLYQFGLLPQDEAVQAADKMVEDHYDQAAIIFPENSWGDKIANAFREQYEGQGGTVVADLNYKSSLNLSKQVCNFLAQDPTELCAYRRKRKKIDSSETLRRQDINAIFLVAPADKAQQIVPLLKFYYADDLPVFAISSVFSGVSNPALDQDINGVYFCDIPWVVKKPESLSGELQAIYDKINTLYPNSSSYSRLYALGIDAYKLAIELKFLLDGSEVGIQGATGTLYLDNYNHVYRKLQWVRMRDGVAVLQ
jgi:outer membrane PBP1 activator LpoA protein